MASARSTANHNKKVGGFLWMPDFVMQRVGRDQNFERLVEDDGLNNVAPPHE